MLKYIQKYQNFKKGHIFHIVTFEQPLYAMAVDDVDRTKAHLVKEYNIRWTPITYHSGGIFLLVKKLWDMCLVFLIASKINRRTPLHRIIGFTTISGAMSYLVSIMIGKPLVLLNIEPHSDYMVEFGVWARHSFAYKTLKYLEKKQMQHASFLAVPTKNAFELLQNDPKIRKHVYFVPTCINLNDFAFNQESRERIRREIGVNEDSKVLVYIGKFGGIYYSIEQMAQTIKKIIGPNNHFSLYVITSDNLEEISVIFDRYELSGRYVLQPQIPYEKIADYLSAGDIGILFIPSHPSQRYRCPIKTANYLACGLPYLITDNIGDESRLAVELDIGVILDENNPIFLEKLVEKKFSRKRLQETVSELRKIDLVYDYFERSLE